ncbi:MAG: pseudouridine synthase [Christensenellales bacterium]|jgi:23S rRNA pseudouridine2605 synthase
MRLNRYLAQAGVCSRRGADDLIAQGAVSVNGRAAQVGDQVEPGRDEVRLRGKLLGLPQQFTYVMLNKPRGVVTTLHDPEGRKTVQDLLAGLPTRVHPVGRLDWDSQGLLLLTDDGMLTARMTHPSHEVDKQYLAKIMGTPSAQALERLRQGVELDGRRTAPAQVERVGAHTKGAVLSVTIHEGRNRQVRRMLEAVDHPVIALKRVRVGPLTLGDLPEGQWRALTDAEVAALRAQTETEQFAENSPSIGENQQEKE